MHSCGQNSLNWRAHCTWLTATVQYLIILAKTCDGCLQSDACIEAQPILPTMDCRTAWTGDVDWAPGSEHSVRSCACQRWSLITGISPPCAPHAGGNGTAHGLAWRRPTRDESVPSRKGSRGECRPRITMSDALCLHTHIEYVTPGFPIPLNIPSGKRIQGLWSILMRLACH